MKTRLPVFDAFPVLFGLGFLSLLWFEARKEGETSFFWITISATFLILGLLIEVDRFLQKRKSSEWMSTYHVGLAVLFGMAVVGLIVFLSR